MKRFLIVGSICLAFLAGAAMTSVAQDDHDRQDEHQNDARPQDEHHDDAHQQQNEHHDNARQDEHAQAAHQDQARRIDDAHFKQHFGSNHHFAIHHVEMVGGRPHFAYGGYNFEIAQAWPAGWSYDDDCYIDYLDGQYYLIDLRHPGIRIALVILP